VPGVRAVFVAGLLVMALLESRAQEIELPPIVVEGTFELRLAPSVTERFAVHLDRQIEAHRALEEAVSRSPLFYAKFWNYVPMRMEASLNDSSQFFLPNYLSADYRNTERVLQESRKQSLFEKP